MFSGVISDRMTSRKAAIAAGFAMGAMAKCGMSFGTTIGQLFIGKAIDRLGNGVQVGARGGLWGLWVCVGVGFSGGGGAVSAVVGCWDDGVEAGKGIEKSSSGRI